MKNTSLLTLALLLFISLTFYNCEKNDSLISLGDVGDFTANIYFIPLSPLADAGSTVACEIEYWTVGDEIVEENLMQEISNNISYEIDYADVDYTYEFEFDTITGEENIYQSYSFDFTSWNPERNAYVVKPTYDVPQAFSKLSFSEKNTDPESFLTYITEDISTGFIIKLVDLLGEDGCREALTNKYTVVEESTFDGKVISDANFEDDEKEYCFMLFDQLDLELLIGEKYEYKNATSVGLRYQILNGFGTIAQSYQRNFTIK